MNSSKRLVLALQKKSTDRTPFWFMRQAGRYLPEYRELRKKSKGFLNFCYTPDMAAEATLQPIKRFGMDGTIIFSDILVIPHALGMDVDFIEGRGPVLTPVTGIEALKKWKPKDIGKNLAPVYEALQLTKSQMPAETALIGFCGAPWTLACYAVNGGTSEDFAKVKAAAEHDREFFSMLIDIFSDSVAVHAINQIEAGAEIIQLFDSWAGIVGEQAYGDWVIAPTKKIVQTIKAKHPQIPIIGFPRQSGGRFEIYAKQTGVDAVSFDDSVPLPWVKERLQPLAVVQGALKPDVLAGDKASMLAEVKNILENLDKPFVFNLSHGILPHTPIENMQALCDYLKKS